MDPNPFIILFLVGLLVGMAYLVSYITGKAKRKLRQYETRDVIFEKRCEQYAARLNGAGNILSRLLLNAGTPEAEKKLITECLKEIRQPLYGDAPTKAA